MPSKNHRLGPSSLGENSVENARLWKTSHSVTRIIAASHPNVGASTQNALSGQITSDVLKTVISDLRCDTRFGDKIKKHVSTEAAVLKGPSAPTGPPPPLPQSQRTPTVDSSATEDQIAEAKGGNTGQPPDVIGVTEALESDMVKDKRTPKTTATTTSQSTGAVERTTGTVPASTVITKNTSAKPVQSPGGELFKTATASPPTSSTPQLKISRTSNEASPVENENTAQAQGPCRHSQNPSENSLDRIREVVKRPPGIRNELEHENFILRVQQSKSTMAATEKIGAPFDMTHVQAMPPTALSLNESQPLVPPANSAQRRSLSVKIVASNSTGSCTTVAESEDNPQKYISATENQLPSKPISAPQDNARTTFQSRPRPSANAAQDEDETSPASNIEGIQNGSRVMGRSIPNQIPVMSASGPETRRLPPTEMIRGGRTPKAPSAIISQIGSSQSPRESPNISQTGASTAPAALTKRPQLSTLPQEDSSPAYTRLASQNASATNQDSTWKIIPLPTSAISAIDTYAAVKDSRWKLLPPFTSGPSSPQKIFPGLASNWKLLPPFAPPSSIHVSCATATQRNVRSIGTQTVSTASMSTRTSTKPGPSVNPAPLGNPLRRPAAPGAPTPARPPIKKPGIATTVPGASKKIRPASTLGTEPAIITPKPMSPAVRSTSAGGSLGVPEPSGQDRRASMGAMPTRKPSPALPPEIAALVKPSASRATPASSAAATILSKPPIQKPTPAVRGPVAQASRPRMPAPPMPDSFKNMPTRKPPPVAAASS